MYIVFYELAVNERGEKTKQKQKKPQKNEVYERDKKKTKSS